MAFSVAGVQVTRISRGLVHFNGNEVRYRLMSSMRRLSTTSPTSEKDIKPVEAIPGPMKLPIFGEVWSLFLEGLMPGAKPLGKRVLDQQIRLIKRYGQIVRVYLPGRDIVVIAEPEDIGNFFRSESKYPKKFGFPVLDYYRETHKKIPGVFFANGEEWYRHRSVISKRILRPKGVADYVPEFNEIITDFIARLREIREPDGTVRENEVRHLDNELFKWSFESVADVLFDRRFGSLEREMDPEAQEFISAIGRFLGSALNVYFLPVTLCKIYETKEFKTFVDSFNKMHHYAEMCIHRRITELRQKDKDQAGESRGKGKAGFFEFLLASDKLTEEDLLASVIDLLFAGVDTTSNTMQWVLYSLAKNPDKQEKLHQEITSVLQRGHQPDAQSLTQMPYLKACIRETLRLYPVLPILSRKLEEDIVIRGYRIPAGTQIDVPLYSLGRSDEWFPEASSFKPERWLRDAKHESTEVKSAFASIPFGFGTRMCIGRRVAELELHLLTCRVVQQFWIEYPHGEEVEPLSRSVTIPDRDLRVRFEDREA